MNQPSGDIASRFLQLALMAEKLPRMSEYFLDLLVEYSGVVQNPLRHHPLRDFFSFIFRNLSSSKTVLIILLPPHVN